MIPTSTGLPDWHEGMPADYVSPAARLTPPKPTACPQCGHMEATTACRFCGTDKRKARAILAAKIAGGTAVLGVLFFLMILGLIALTDADWSLARNAYVAWHRGCCL